LVLTSENGKNLSFGIKFVLNHAFFSLFYSFFSQELQYLGKQTTPPHPAISPVSLLLSPL